jgi:hypothetical protein
VRVLIVAAGIAEGAQPTWTCDGNAVVPKVLRKLTSVRGQPGGVLTGLFEFPDLAPGSPRIEATLGGASKSCTATVLPGDLVTLGDDGLNVLLVSCYHYEHADGAGLAKAVESAKRLGQPELVLLMGDQIYGDLPTLKDFDSSTDWLARKIEDDYVRNWNPASSFASVLGAASSVSLSDDHEFWNNAPNESPFLQNTWTSEHRANWTKAAELNLDAFQPWPEGLGVPVRIDVAPVSIVLADGRRQRRKNLSRAFAPGVPEFLEAWIEDCNQRALHPVFVTGQSMFAEPIGRLKGKVADWEMPNYGDYAAVLAALTRSQQPLLCVTGDVHWGRVLRGVDSRGGADVHEVIVSPAALVSDVSSDWAKKGWSSVKGLFGNKDPWPRHAKPDSAPEAFAKAATGRTFACKTSHEQVGDQIALLTFRLRGGRVHAEVTYFPVTTAQMPASTVAIYPT